MANLKEIVEGAIDNIAQETIDENTYYNIDMADGGITNAQMASAIAHPEFFNDGDVYQCIDSGTYTEKHFYKFNGTTWVDVTLEWGYPMLTGASDPTSATEGLVNQLYRNTTSNALFVCTAVTSGTPNTYTWTAVGGGSTMYLHKIVLSGNISTSIITTSSTQFITATLADFLYNSGFNSGPRGLPAVSVVDSEISLSVFANSLSTLQRVYKTTTSCYIDNQERLVINPYKTTANTTVISDTVT